MLFLWGNKAILYNIYQRHKWCSFPKWTKNCVLEHKFAHRMRTRSVTPPFQRRLWVWGHGHTPHICMNEHMRIHIINTNAFVFYINSIQKLHKTWLHVDILPYISNKQEVMVKIRQDLHTTLLCSLIIFTPVFDYLS